MKISDTDLVRVLIVEDSLLTATQICEAVRDVDSRIKCSVVATEREALASIADASPQIVVLDLCLKDGNGFGVLANIRASDQRPLVVVMTNYALPQYRDFAFLRGADYFLDKAVSMEEVPKILHSVLQNRSQPTAR